jgi:hypothetical protein
LGHLLAAIELAVVHDDDDIPTSPVTTISDVPAGRETALRAPGAIHCTV